MRHVCKWSALAICVVLAVLTALLVLPGLFGIHPLVVQSRSMEPAYPKGSMIYVRSTDPFGLSEGSAVTFSLPDSDTLVTHRITHIDMDREEIYTKGDANEQEDRTAIPFGQVEGVPFFCVPYLGYLADYLSSMAGKVGIIMLVILVCLLSWMDGALLKEEKEALEE